MMQKIRIQTIKRIPPVIGHRGARAYAPENTLAGIYKAKALGVQWVEVDVMLTSCGEAILMHDTRLDRTTDGRGEVGKTPYSLIATLDAGAWFSEEFKGEPVPRFIDFIHCLKECQLGANIEIKPYPGKEKETARTVVEILHKHWPSILPPPLVSSFSLESMRVARQLDAQLLLGLLTYRWPRNWAALAKELNCFSVHAHYSRLNPKRVNLIKEAGYAALAYTVNEEERARRLFAMGVDAVFSDYPDKILSM